MSRANHNAETSTVASTESTEVKVLSSNRQFLSKCLMKALVYLLFSTRHRTQHIHHPCFLQSHQWKPHHLTAPKSPVLQTSLRARPPRIKSSEELEKEELEHISQFKARPLNRKVIHRHSTFW